MITKLSSQQRDFNTKLSSLLSWESVSNKDVANTVEEIINTIRSKGDKALIDYSIKFDGVKAKSMADLIIPQEELEIIQGLMSTGKNVILVTHHVHEIPPEITRAILLKEAKVVDDGDKTKILTGKILSKLFDRPIKIIEENGFYQALPG